MRRVCAIRAARLRLRRCVLRWWALERAWAGRRVRVAGDEVLADFAFLLVAFLLVADFFACAEEWTECVDAVTVDCAANDGTKSESANTPARQDAAGWAEKIRGTTSIMFSLYADFFPLPGPGTTSVTTLKWNKRLAPTGQSSHPALFCIQG
jgi:hypothetical protein